MFLFGLCRYSVYASAGGAVSFFCAGKSESRDHVGQNGGKTRIMSSHRAKKRSLPSHFANSIDSSVPADFKNIRERKHAADCKFATRHPIFLFCSCNCKCCDAQESKKYCILLKKYPTPPYHHYFCQFMSIEPFAEILTE